MTFSFTAPFNDNNFYWEEKMKKTRRNANEGRNTTCRQKAIRGKKSVAVFSEVRIYSL